MSASKKSYRIRKRKAKRLATNYTNYKDVPNLDLALCILHSPLLCWVPVILFHSCFTSVSAIESETAKALIATHLQYFLVTVSRFLRKKFSGPIGHAKDLFHSPFITHLSPFCISRSARVPAPFRLRVERVNSHL